MIGKDFVTYPFGYENTPFPEQDTPEHFLVSALVDQLAEDENLRRCEAFSCVNEESEDFVVDKTFSFSYPDGDTAE